MDGSGARDGFGAPPWGPADPVPELDETQAIPGLGAHQEPGDGPGHQEDRGYRNSNGSGNGNGSSNGYGAPGRPNGTASRGPGRPNGTAAGGSPWPTGGNWSQQPPPNGFGQRAGGAPSGYDQPGYDNRGHGNQGYGNGGYDQQVYNQPGYGNPAGNDGRSQRDGGAQSRPRGSHRAGSSNPGGPGAPGTDPGTDQDPEASPGTKGTPRRRRSFWRELPVLVVVALVLALIIKSFAIQAFYIPSASMEKTLEVGDRVLINKVAYHLRSIHRGDIIVFDGSTTWDAGTQQSGSSNIFSKALDELEGIVGISHDSSIYIKRVIGLPGDTVRCCTEGRVTVNGVALSEKSYLYPGDAPSATPFKEVVPAGMLWVMGDHRSVSYDSRGHTGDPGGGAIPESAVLGRAFVIIWPPSHWGFLNIPATFEQPKLNAVAVAAAGGQAAAGGSTATLESALANGTPLQPAYSALPLALGFAGALPLTWLHRRLRTRRRKAKLKVTG